MTNRQCEQVADLAKKLRGLADGLELALQGVQHGWEQVLPHLTANLAGIHLSAAQSRALRALEDEVYA